MQRTFVLGPYSLPSRVLTAGTRAGLAVANALEAGHDGVERLPDLAYGAGARHRLDAYRPRAVRAPCARIEVPGDPEPTGRRARPVVVFLHGGNWTYFGKDDFRYVGHAFAERGVVAVVPSYRCYPDADVDDQLLDAARAVAWTRRHAHELGADPARVHVIGHSSGAHVAALLALDGRRLARVGGTREWLAGFVGLNGPYWFATDANPHMRRFFGAPERHADALPVRFASAGAPRTLLVHGAADRMVRPRNSRELARRLARAGADVTLRLVPGDGHGTVLERWIRSRRQADPVLDTVAAFVAGARPPDLSRNAAPAIMPSHPLLGTNR